MTNQYKRAINEMIALIDDGVPEYVARDHILDKMGHVLTDGQRGTLFVIADNWQGQRKVDALQDAHNGMRG